MWGYSLWALPSSLTNVIAIAAGYSQVLTLLGDGTVAAWGDDTFGQTAVPAGLSNVVGVAAGDYSSFALQSDGTVLAWGSVWAGGPNEVAATVPSGLTNVQALGAAGDHCVAMLGDGTLTTWGLFWSSTGDFPAAIPTALTNAGAIAVGADHDLALVGALPPSFTAPLLSRSVPAGRTVQFVANATGSMPLTYQWQCNGTNVPGATNAFLLIPDAQARNGGDYWVWCPTRKARHERSRDRNGHSPSAGYLSAADGSTGTAGRNGSLCRLGGRHRADKLAMAVRWRADSRGDERNADIDERSAHQQRYTSQPQQCSGLPLPASSQGWK